MIKTEKKNFQKKNYKSNKLRQFIKTNTLLLFTAGITQPANAILLVNQKLQTNNLSCYKLSNKTTQKNFEKSIFFNVYSLINGTTFGISQIDKKKPILKKTTKSQLESLFFNIIIIKLNNKFYPSINSFSNINSLFYKKELLLFYQFKKVNLKSNFRLKS